MIDKTEQLCCDSGYCLICRLWSLGICQFDAKFTSGMFNPKKNSRNIFVKLLSIHSLTGEHQTNYENCSSRRKQTIAIMFIYTFFIFLHSTFSGWTFFFIDWEYKAWNRMGARCGELVVRHIILFHKRYHKRGVLFEPYGWPPAPVRIFFVYCFWMASCTYFFCRGLLTFRFDICRNF